MTRRKVHKPETPVQSYGKGPIQRGFNYVRRLNQQNSRERRLVRRGFSRSIRIADVTKGKTTFSVTLEAVKSIVHSGLLDNVPLH